MLLVELDADLQVPELVLDLAAEGKGFHLLRGVDGVGHQFAQEYLVVRIQELLDHREYVLGSHSYFTFVFHICSYLLSKKVRRHGWRRI